MVDCLKLWFEKNQIRCKIDRTTDDLKRKLLMPQFPNSLLEKKTLQALVVRDVFPYCSKNSS